MILEQAGVDLKNLKPREIVVPVKDTEPQPGKSLHHVFE